jgi:branched-chain amino acid transport system substrate-binding protein
MPAPPLSPYVAGGAAGADIVRVGMLLPLSSPRAQTGQALLQAAQLALFDFADPRLVLLPSDTQGTAAGAARAAQAALAAGAELILGPVFAEEVAAAANVTRAAGRNMIAFSSDRRVAGNGVFLLSFLPEQEVTRIMSYARGRGLTRIAALVPRTAYGERVAEIYKLAAAVPDGGSPKLVYYLPNSQSMHAPIRQLSDYDARHRKLTEEIARLEANTDAFAQQALAEMKTRDTLGEVEFDAVLIADGGASLRALIPLLEYYEIDPKKVRYLGTGLWNESAIHTEPALLGGWYPASLSDSSSNFAERMQSSFGVSVTPVIGLGYDAVALATVLAGQGREPGARFSTQALTIPSGFSGIQGIFRLRADGLSERGLAVMEVAPEGVRVIDPPPASFDPVLN